VSPGYFPPMRKSLFLLPFVLFFAACAVEEDDLLDSLGPFDTTGFAITNSGLGPSGPSANSTNGARTEVWAVTRAWEDTDSEAGMAWGAGSGLSWEDKYAAWIQSMERTTTHSGNRETFTITTPYGKSLPVGYLECAELAMTMRVLFASWYGLPFYMQAKDRGTDIYMGHFGFRTKTGRYRTTPEYRVKYSDYSGRANQADLLDNWPSDTQLRGRKLYGNNDDINLFMGDSAHAGMYFDELLLNKRVGHMLIMFLPMFGSINIADDANAYHATAPSLRPGDVLLKRWQKRGIGHVMLTKSVVERADGKLTAELASGSMPRRQAVWESPAASKMLYTNKQTGGEGDNWDGDAFVSLGGGLKRWNAPFIDNGTWRQRVPPSDRDNFIPTADLSRRSERPALFQDLLVTPSPEMLRDELLAIIEDRRAHLRDHPSSCSARIAREAAWVDLYELMEDKFNMSRAETDAEYRIVDDYVFAELIYNQSKTCCWNGTDRQMYDAIMAFTDQQSQDAQACVAPLVFKARDGGGYDAFSDYATANGFNWNPWSEDESCPAADTDEDVETPTTWTDFCEVFGDGGEEPTPDPSNPDPYEANNSRSSAFVLDAEGTYEGASITDGDVDWFRIAAPTDAVVRVRVRFNDDDGDLDVKMNRDDEQVDSSTSWSSDIETVDATNDGISNLYVKVFGYDGATNDYSIEVEFEGGVDLGEPCDDGNEVQDDAISVDAGGYQGLALCGASDPVDWYRLGATVGDNPVTVRGENGASFRMGLYRSSGDLIEETTGVGSQTLDMPTGVKYLKIEGANGAIDLPYSLFVAVDPPQ